MLLRGSFNAMMKKHFYNLFPGCIFFLTEELCHFMMKI